VVVAGDFRASFRSGWRIYALGSNPAPVMAGRAGHLSIATDILPRLPPGIWELGAVSMQWAGIV